MRQSYLIDHQLTVRFISRTGSLYRLHYMNGFGRANRQLLGDEHYVMGIARDRYWL